VFEVLTLGMKMSRLESNSLQLDSTLRIGLAQTQLKFITNIFFTLEFHFFKVHKQPTSRFILFAQIIFIKDNLYFNTY
jgi:hypothetical protein